MQHIMGATDYLGKEVTILIDRPLGTIHPEHQHIYDPINYGYVPNVLEKDQEELMHIFSALLVPLKKFPENVLRSSIE